jgi:hypothetical protein
MSATADLRTALMSLCNILESSLHNLPAGLASPELFRQAKNDDKNAVGPILTLLNAFVMQTLQIENIKTGLSKLNIAPPSDWKSSAALLTVFIIPEQT